MIEARDLTKCFGPKLAVDHLPFPAGPGRVTGFPGLIIQAAPASGQVLSAWPGFGVFCRWTAAPLAAAGILLMRRDA